MCKVRIKPIDNLLIMKNGFNNKSLAVKANVSAATISFMCNKNYCENNWFKSETVKAVFDCLDVNVIDFIIEKKIEGHKKTKNRNKTPCEPNTRLKELREKMRLNPGELEAAAHVGHGTVGDIENGRNTVSDKTLKKIAEVLGTDVDTLKGKIPAVQTELELTEAAESYCEPEQKENHADTDWLNNILEEEIRKAHDGFMETTKATDKKCYASIVCMCADLIRGGHRC